MERSCYERATEVSRNCVNCGKRKCREPSRFALREGPVRFQYHNKRVLFSVGDPAKPCRIARSQAFLSNVEVPSA